MLHKHSNKVAWAHGARTSHNFSSDKLSQTRRLYAGYGVSSNGWILIIVSQKDTKL